MGEFSKSFNYGLHLYKWHNKKHPDNPNFQQVVFWIADFNDQTLKYKIGYHLGDRKTKWVKFGECENIASFEDCIKKYM